MDSIDTTWEIWAYNVWKNQKEGYEVNDRLCIDRSYPLRLKIRTANADTPQEFQYAFPTDAQIRGALGVRGISIDTDGNDLHIIVNRARNRYPIGEMICTSHKSLSHIKEKE